MRFHKCRSSCPPMLSYFHTKQHAPPGMNRATALANGFVITAMATQVSKEIS